jgi:endonuclease/exonuclease/phosphatase family metal-dependent hydrolase
MYEGLYTAYRKDKFSLLGSDIFWLSPTPYEAGSRYERQSIYPRICVMTELRNKGNNEIFRLYNVHLDHEQEEARILGLTSVFAHIDRCNSKKNEPTILCGDFNAEPQETAVCIANERVDFKDFTTEFETTYHDFGRLPKACKIDYIYVSKQWWERVEETRIWDDCCSGIYLSDHYPICMKLKEKI